MPFVKSDLISTGVLCKSVSCVVLSQFTRHVYLKYSRRKRRPYTVHVAHVLPLCLSDLITYFMNIMKIKSRSVCVCVDGVSLVSQYHNDGLVNTPVTQQLHEEYLICQVLPKTSTQQLISIVAIYLCLSDIAEWWVGVNFMRLRSQIWFI